MRRVYRTAGVLVLTALAFSCFLLFDPGFHGADEPIYFAYTSSIVEDGDLNVVDEVHRPHDTFYVTRTFNLPALHNHGGILAWMPFYVYARAAAAALRIWGVREAAAAEAFAAEKCLMSLSTILFGFGVLFMSYLLARRFYPVRSGIISVAALFAGTPLFYYMLMEGGNANIIAAFFMALSMLVMFSMDKASRYHWFMFGVLFSFCLTIKVDLWFLTVLILIFFAESVRLRRARLSGSVWFFAGLAPVLGMKLINDFLKYGVFHSGEAGLINVRGNYFFEQLFSSYRGYFYSSPILLVCMGAGLASAVTFLAARRSAAADDPSDRLCTILFAYICIKLAICSFRYAWGGGNAGARQLLADFPIFVLLFCRVFSVRSALLRWLVLFISCACIFWNLLTIAEYYAQVDLITAPFALDFSPNMFLPRMGRIGHLLAAVAAPKAVAFKAWLSLPLVLFLAGCIVVLRRRTGFVKRAAAARAFPRALAITLAYMMCAYAAITGMNAYNNPRNSVHLRRSGAYPNAVPISPGGYERFERESCYVEMTQYFTLMRDEYRIEQQLKLRKALDGD